MADKLVRVGFGPEMVRAILAGRKCVTRRKPSAKWKNVGAGDVLVMTETWAPVPSSAYRHSEGIQQTVNPGDPDMAAIYRYGFDRANGGFLWRSSRFMPSWASRFRARIVSVREEPLHAITEEDAEREGVFKENGKWIDYQAAMLCLGAWLDSPRDSFATLWDVIHGLGAWDANPTVTRIEFENAAAGRAEG